MRIRLLALTLSLAALNAHAQNDLSGSRQTSVCTYIYRLDPKQALHLYRGDMDGWDKIISAPVDSFLSSTQQDDDLHLSAGDYLFVMANGSRLRASLRTVGPLRYDLLSSRNDAALSLHTPDGRPITDAVVHIGKRRVGFDP